MLHGSHCIQSGSIVLHCMESTAFNQDPLGQAACNPLHSLCMNFTLLHGIQCIKSHCMESTAFNRVHCGTLHGFHCIQSGSITPRLMQSTAFTMDAFHTAAWNPVHSITLHGIHCIQSVSITPSCINPLHSIEIQCTTLH